MPPRSFKDHVQSLIGRQVAEQKVVGTSSSDVEARAVLESIALNLLLKPRSVMYLAHLARNALLNVVNQELAAIDTLSKTIDDTANATFIPNSTLHLDKARTALLQMEGLEKIDASTPDFKRFNKSIEDFLDKTLSKSVRKHGGTELRRPDTEAAVDLASDFAALVELHSELNERFYALSVGIENFTSSPLGTILGLSTAYRARVDIEEIIELIENGESGSQARDIAIRLLGDRAALKTVGALPVLNKTLVDTQNNFPTGYVLRAVTDPAHAVAVGSVGPFVWPGATGASVTVNGDTISRPAFPQTGTHLDNRAFVVTSPFVFFPFFPITLPAGKHLFLHLRRTGPAAGYELQPDGSYLRQVRVTFTPGAITLAQFLADINTALGADGEALEYLQVNSGRVIIIAAAGISSIQVASMVAEPSTTTLGDVHIYDQSLHENIGLELFQMGTSGSTPVGIILDAIFLFFSSLVSVSVTEEGRIRIESNDDSPGVLMSLSLPGVGLSSSYIANSNSIKLYGTVNGKEPPAVVGDVPTPVDPIPLMDVGDSFDGPTAGATITGLTTTRIILQNAVPTFDGHIVIESELVDRIQDLDRTVQFFVPIWLKTPYAQGLTTLDRAIAALSGKTTPATRAAAKEILNDLKTQVQTLVAVLTQGELTSSIGTEERSIVSGIINTLTERRYDRALSLLLRLQVQEFFELTGESASYGGNLLKTMTDFATTDIKFPNLQADEDSGFKGEIKEPEA